LGYEFPQTLFILTQDGITIVTTKKKGMARAVVQIWGG
jgi:nucleosome binding factor SPN SPT16 subunit